MAHQGNEVVMKIIRRVGSRDAEEQASSPPRGFLASSTHINNNNDNDNASSVEVQEDVRGLNDYSESTERSFGQQRLHDNSTGTESASTEKSFLRRRVSQTTIVAASATEVPPLVVEVGYRIYSVTDINNVKNTASVDMRIFLLFRDEAMVGKRGLDGGHRPEEYLAEQLEQGNLSSRPYFPYVEIANAASTEEIDRGYRVVSGNGDVKFHFRVRAVVLQNLRFHCFPFDRHDIMVKIRIPRKRDSDGVSFITSGVYGGGGKDATNNDASESDCEGGLLGHGKRRGKMSKQNSTRSIKSYYDSISDAGGVKGPATAIVESYAHEWDFDRPQMRIVDEKRGSSSSSKSTIQVIVPVSRHYHHYVHDILVILGFIVFAAGSVFFYEVSDLEGRINLIISCILTTVAFKFVCLEKIPPAPYATLLDIYIRTLFLMCGLAIIFCILASRAASFYRRDREEGLDEEYLLAEGNYVIWFNNLLGYCWLAFFIAVHIVYIIFVKKRCNLDIRRRLEARKGFI